jgi:glycosyltransferase involved in cell wall biosynthesis
VSGRLTIVRPGLPLPPPAPGETVVSFDDFRGWIRRGTALAHVGRHRDGRVLVHRIETAGRPLPLSLALRAMCRGRISIDDATGRSRAVTGIQLARWLAQAASEPLRVAALVSDIEQSVAALEQTVCDRTLRPLNRSASPLYLRTDLSFGVRAGGSVGHTAGVVNELNAFTGPPILLTTDDVPTVNPDVEVHSIAPDDAFWNFSELPTFVMNATAVAAAERVVGVRELAFVYQRYSVNNFTGIHVSRRHGVPFVLEYNGSEVWVGRHWGRPLRYEKLTGRIELLNARAADLVVVVSRPLADELTARGIAADKILVNPNGVNTNRYRPDIDGAGVRARYGLDDRGVIGFIGTFGPWHGAEVLARAFVALCASDPALAASIRLLLIGDGATLSAVRRILSDGGVIASTVFAGLVPQDEGPAYLGACDVLASPHVPNPDGTPFFGSPTKLFEYMAMGKAIVASDLDQIGEVLEHGRTAWLVRPGAVDDLAAGLRRLLVDRGLRERLGAEARRCALAKHTWRVHTQRTVERLQEIAAAAHGRQPARS